LNNDSNSQDKLTDEELFGIYFILFAAGTSTTSRLISMCLYLLTLYPQYKTQIRSEAAQFITDIDNPSYEDLSKLKMLDAVVKETVRLYAPLQEVFPREAVNDTQIGQVKVKKGTVVSVYLNSHSWNEKYYYDAEKFIPERWLGEKKDIDPYVSLPFYAGPKHCLGKYLADIEVKMFLIKALKEFDFELKAGFELKMEQKFLYEPSEPIPMKFTKLVQ